VLANQKNVLVIVPAEDVMLTDAKLPKMSRSRLLQTIPFALEERLIDDVETLHFAIAEPSNDGHVSVAIVARHKMQQWLALLQAWQIRADVLLPASLALPFTHSIWHVAFAEEACVRTGEISGFACDKQNLDIYLNAALSTLTALPEQLIIHNYTPQAIVATLNLPIAVKEELIQPERMLEEVAQQVSNHLPLNLLQGTYSAKRKVGFPKLNNMWRAAAYFSIALFALLFIYPTGSYIILKQRENNLQNQISQIYRQHFTQEKTMIAPKLRMEDKLHKLQAEMGENQLLLLLGYVGKGLSQTSGIHLKRFDFQNGQLTVELNATNSQNFSAFNVFLTQQGLQVKQQNAILSGERVNATLQIE